MQHLSLFKSSQRYIARAEICNAFESLLKRKSNEQRIFVVTLPPHRISSSVDQPMVICVAINDLHNLLHAIKFEDFARTLFLSSSFYSCEIIKNITRSFS